MKFKVGDLVKIVNPELSTWRDTLDAIANHNLSMEAVYTVESITIDGGVFLKEPNWWLSYHCLDFANKKYKRNLPSWW